ncbi:MAG TPA: hypothetical protein DCQ31_00490, partial [Bacteroidales bacterium]|nr:hypothetical protein [Bacteroidales bacterium]
KINVSFRSGRITERFLNISGAYTRNYSYLGSNSIMVSDYNASQKILLLNRDNASLTGNVSSFINPILSTLKLNCSMFSSKYQNIINESELRKVQGLYLDYGFELRSGFKGIFNFHLGTKWNNYSVYSTYSSSITNNISFINLFFVFNKKIDFAVQTERYFIGKESSKNNEYYF